MVAGNDDGDGKSIFSPSKMARSPTRLRCPTAPRM
jgi:hypothetical protein